jgi:hypothetical protein
MLIDSELGGIIRSVQALRGFGVVPGISSRLRKVSEQTSGALLSTVVKEVLAFTTSANPDVLPELEHHLQRQVDSVCDILAGLPPNLDFVAEHAARRAEQKFPLDAQLDVYRCLHRQLAESVRDAALEVADESAQVRRVAAAVSDFTIEYMGTIGTVLTSEYVSHTRRLAEAEGDRRTELFNLLLRGYDESDGRALQLLRRGGYLEQRQSYCVAVARSVDPREMENAPRAQRMADAVSEALRDLPIRVLIGVRDNRVIVVMSGIRRISGWTAPQSLLADRVYPPLRKIGPAALIGVSTDAPSTTHIPAAVREATLALDFASVGDRVMSFSRIPFCNMLVRVAADKVQAALPDWVDAFREANEKARGSLIETLQAYADADMNVLKTAKAMSLHPNTIYARMRRIEDITGRNPLSYGGLTEMLLAMECVTRSS